MRRSQRAARLPARAGRCKWVRAWARERARGREAAALPAHPAASVPDPCSPTGTLRRLWARPTHDPAPQVGERPTLSGRQAPGAAGGRASALAESSGGRPGDVERAPRRRPHLSQPRRSASSSTAAAASGAPSSTLHTTRATRSPPPCARARARARRCHAGPAHARRRLSPSRHAAMLCAVCAERAQRCRAGPETTAPPHVFAFIQEVSKRAERAGSIQQRQRALQPPHARRSQSVAAPASRRALRTSAHAPGHVQAQPDTLWQAHARVGYPS